MKLRYRILVCAAAMALLVAGAPSAKEESIKEDARKAGRAVGSAAREVWQGAKKAGKEVGHEAKKAGQAVGSAAKEGARESKRAFKGEKCLPLPTAPVRLMSAGRQTKGFDHRPKVLGRFALERHALPRSGVRESKNSRV
jgi:hypothetical protein